MDLSGKTVAVTGTFSKLSRSELESKLAARGAHVAGSITKKTSLLFAGDDAGSKRVKAEQLGIPIYGEAELDALLGAEPASREGALTPGTTRLGDFRERLITRIAELASRSDIKILYEFLGDPVSPTLVDTAAAKCGVSLGPEERELYARMNGCFLVWVPVNAPEYDKAIHKPKKGRPPMSVLESLPTNAFRIIAMPPIEEVFGRPLDYARFLDDPTPRLGFDFPGNYTTPALVVREGKVVVEVGDDHGAAWPSGSSTLEDYVETVLGIWGDVNLRCAIYLQGERGVGRAYFDAHPVPLTDLLPPPLPASAAEENKLLRLLKRKVGRSLTDAELADAARATHSSNADLVTVALDRLREQPTRAKRHASTLVAALDTIPRSDLRATLTSLIDGLAAPLSLAERRTVLGSRSYRWVPVGRVAAGGGTELLPAIETLLRSDAASKDTGNVASGDGPFNSVLAAVHAALLLGPEAASLLSCLEALVQPADFEARTKWGWDDRVTLSLAAATAVVSIDPERASALWEHLRILIRSAYVPLTSDRAYDPRSSELVPLMARLPRAIAERLAGEIATLEGPSMTLLSGLAGGVEVTLDRLEEHPTSETLLAILARASLSSEQRARAMTCMKAQLPANAGSPQYVGYLWHIGGIDACAPTLGRSAVVKGLVENVRYIHDAHLARSVFEMLRAEGADPAKLKASAENVLERYPQASDWLTPYAVGG